MAGELGKIEKPMLGQFQGKRKLYVIPLLYSSADAPPDYLEKFERFWQQISEQIAGQESKVGKINRIYHETVSTGGDAGVNLIEKVNALSYRIVKEKVSNGAVFEAVEEDEMVGECMDWERCLMLGFYSHKVAENVQRNYIEAAKKRFEHIGRRIDETLKENEVALLFIREGHSVQFAADIDVFVMAPPALDEINRWLRDRRDKPAESQDK